jgi:hypothetical protein
MSALSRTTIRRFAAALATAAAIGLLSWLAWRAFGDARKDPSRGEGDATSGEVLALAPLGAKIGAPETSDEAAPGEVGRAAGDSDEQRSSTARPLARGRVVDQDSNPVRNASVTWTPLDPYIDGFDQVWDSIDWNELEGRSRVAVTVENGEFGFDGSIESESNFGSVLWVVCDGFVAQHLLLPPGAASDPSPWTIMLQSDEGLRLRVVEIDGSPAPAADVRQFARAPKDRAVGKREWAAFAVFHRQLPLDREARCVATSLPAMSVFTAALGNRRASPAFVTRESGREIELRLLDTFTLTGRVRVTDGTQPSGQMNVNIGGITGGATYRAITMKSVRADLNFGPIDVPLGGEQNYVVAVQGGGLASERVRIDRPSAGEHVEVLLETGRGASQPFIVRDQESKPIEGADISVRWWNANKSGSGASARTDSEGRASVTGILAGSVYFSVSAAGYVPQSYGPVEMPLSNDDSAAIEMERGFDVRGRCTHSGKPLSDFDVIWWPEVALDRRIEAFMSQADGQFVLHGVPPRPIYIMACTAELPQSPVLRVDPSQAAGQVFELVLPDPLVGRGQIVDAENDAPLASATVQLWAHFGGMTAARRGVPHGVDDAGRFEFDGFSPGESRIILSAPGYSDRELSAHATDGRVVDFGTVGLTRPGTWTVRLMGVSAEQAPATTITLNGPHATPVGHFDASGTAVMSSIGPGRWYATVEFPDADPLYFNEVLAPASSWRTEIPFDASRSLEVRIRAEQGAEIARPLDVLVRSRPSARVPIQRWAVAGDDGIARIAGLGVGELSLDVFAAGTVVYSGRARMDAQETRIDIELKAGRIRGRVLEANGAPLGAATVVAMDASGGCWEFDVRCDFQGTCEFPLPDIELISIRATHPDVGEGAARILTSAERRDGTFEIVLDPRSRLEVLASELGAARRGVRLDVFDATRRTYFGTIDADSNGIATQARLDVADYVVSVATPGVWREEHRVAVTDPSSVHAIEVRSLGALEVIVLDEQDAPLAGVDVELHCLDLDTDVEVWIAAERVAAPAGGLRTDENGALRLAGLPRGAYRARANGVEATGQVVRATTSAITLRAR